MPTINPGSLKTIEFIYQIPVNVRGPVLQCNISPWLPENFYKREPLKTAVFSPSLTQAVRNPQICLFFVQFRLFLGFFVPHSSRIGPLQAHLGL